MEPEKFYYDNKIVKYFAYATIFWGVTSMLVGLLIATQMIWPAANFNFELTTFGRVRPIHTNAAIFAFVGNAIFMGVYYSLQRLSKARMFSNVLSYIHFWGWQLIIVLAVITLPLGITTSKEYAELEWPIDLLIAVVWVSYAVVFFGTIMKRKVKHIYVANWFFGAFILTVFGGATALTAKLMVAIPVYQLIRLTGDPDQFLFQLTEKKLPQTFQRKFA